MDPHGDTRQQYRDFVTHASDSPSLGAWAASVAEDDDVLAWIGSLPGIKTQPNLVFGAARHHGVAAPGPYAALREALLGDDGTIRATILERSTQTNEARRSATLLPAFSLLADGGAVSLLEVGASAGLCLYPDRWDYRWSTPAGDVVLDTGQGRELSCVVEGPAPLPSRPLEVAWRGGVDLNPLDVADADQAAWLETLIWPEHDDRRALLREAVAVATAEPATIVAGDLLEETEALVEQAAAHAPVIVFHTAVIAYLSDVDRERFHQLMTGLVARGACHWVSNEAPRVLPAVTATAASGPVDGSFVLGIDGVARAFAHGHGRRLTWL